MSSVAERSDVLVGQLIIGDVRLTQSSGGSFDHVYPVTGKVQKSLPLAGPGEVDRAVGAARTALAEWRRWTPAARRRAMLRLASFMRRDADQLATIMALEIGIPVTHAPILVDFGADWLEDAAGWADRLYGEVAPAEAHGALTYGIPEPYGVVAVMTTWNGSAGAFGMAVGPALAAGCTVVVKPSELAPFGVIHCAELALEAGIPPGVVNVIPGGAEAGDTLVRHPGIDKITFTGSPQTARKIAASAAESLTPCVFELGGKSASLVFGDASLERAITSALALTFNSGQACTLGSRLLVEAKVYDQFVAGLTGALSLIRQGDPFDQATMMGPVASRGSLERILALIERSRAHGRIAAGGERLGGQFAEGFFVAPTVVTDIDNSAEINQEEVFGPVVSVVKFHDEDEAVAIANNSPFGLAAYLFTTDLTRTHRVAAALDASNVGVNGGTAPASMYMPFGGRKLSGYGRQGGLSGVMEFVNTKTVQVRLD